MNKSLYLSMRRMQTEERGERTSIQSKLPDDILYYSDQVLTGCYALRQVFKIQSVHLSSHAPFMVNSAHPAIGREQKMPFSARFWHCYALHNVQSVRFYGLRYALLNT